ncbi:MAG: AAA family ATPase [Lachnospiraceae bacterium]|nr:AAA family ATPase [Lachnospiraceae bacterium]
MNKVFLKKNPMDISDYIASEIRDYQEFRADTEENPIDDPALIVDYLTLIVYYLVKCRPRSDHDIDSICKLMGASYFEEGRRTPFWAIISEASTTYSNDPVFADGADLENEITNEDIDQCFRFIEYEVLFIDDEEERDSHLGMISVCKVKYNHSAQPPRLSKDRLNIGKGRDLINRRQFEKFLEAMTPESIKAYLDRFVVGQDETKKILSTAVYNHYLRLANPDAKLIKTNILMVGPTGSGKTEMIRRISNLVNVPVVVTDFSGIVATPWKGRNKEEALTTLYERAGRDIEMAQSGIVFCDEFDKIVPSKRYSRGGDINDELQGQLLGMLEGTELDVPVGGSSVIRMDTTNILFVCAGAFEGLDKIVEKDIGRSGIGFGSDIKKTEPFQLTRENLDQKHLIKYGMKPELAGRLHAVGVLNKLTREQLKCILTESEDNVIKRYENEFREEEDVKLTFTDEALDVIIEKVLSMDIGARGLNSVIHDILKVPLFEVPSDRDIREVTVTGAAARGEDKPEYSY